MTEHTQTTRHKNGLNVVTDQMQHVRSVTLGFFFRKGARDEPKDLNGITHFIEHAVFKGTRKRSALEIAIEQDRLGGNLEAFTTHEEIGFAIKLIDDKLERAFDLIADMLIDPLFDEKELKSERRVIIEEMKMTEDSPEESLGEIFSRGFFPDHPLGLPITGTPKTVRGFDRKRTKNYHAKIFNSSNLVIVAAGNVKHEKVLGLAERALSSSFSLSSVEKNTLKRELKTRGPKIGAPILIKQNKNFEQAHVMIGTPIVSAVDKRRYAADLLTNIIGGGTSSRLWQKIREEKGLAYTVGASGILFRDCGIFTIFAGASPEHTSEIVDLAIAELRKIVSGGVNAEELELAKEQARATVLLNLEDSASRAAALAQSEMIHGHYIPVEETLRNIAAVTRDDITELSREFFRTENVAFAALGNLKGLKIDRNRLSIS